MKISFMNIVVKEIITNPVKEKISESMLWEAGELYLNKYKYEYY